MKPNGSNPPALTKRKLKQLQSSALTFCPEFPRISQRWNNWCSLNAGWADSPFTVPTCDFNALIGTDDFEDVCMPSLRDQARCAGLCIFHLDGPDAARHAEILAKDADITAVQFTPGARIPSVLAKLDMFRMIQSHKVPLFVETPYDEVEKLVGELDPRGLAIRVSGVGSPKEADTLLKLIEQMYP